jgi:hypothetical protein
MNRNNLVDLSRSIAFILMFIYHFYSFDYSVKQPYPNYINNIGTISRTTFILLVGISIELFKKEYNNLSEDAYKITLEEGDLLYVPRGWFHMATADEEGSTHITFGIATPTLLDYISESIDASLWSMSKNTKFRKLINKNTDSAQCKEILKKSLNDIMNNIETISNNNFTQQWKLNYPLGRRDDIFLIYKDMEKIIQDNQRFSVLGDSFNFISKCMVSGDSFLLLEGYKLIGEVEHLNAIQRVLAQESLTIEDLLAVIDDNTLVERVVSQLLQMGCVMFKND